MASTTKTDRYTTGIFDLGDDALTYIAELLVKEEEGPWFAMVCRDFARLEARASKRQPLWHRRASLGSFFNNYNSVLFRTPRQNRVDWAVKTRLLGLQNYALFQDLEKPPFSALDERYALATNHFVDATQRHYTHGLSKDHDLHTLLSAGDFKSFEFFSVRFQQHSQKALWEVLDVEYRLMQHGVSAWGTAGMQRLSQWMEAVLWAPRQNAADLIQNIISFADDAWLSFWTEKSGVPARRLYAYLTRRMVRLLAISLLVVSAGHDKWGDRLYKLADSLRLTLMDDALDPFQLPEGAHRHIDRRRLKQRSEECMEKAREACKSWTSFFENFEDIVAASECTETDNHFAERRLYFGTKNFFRGETDELQRGKHIVCNPIRPSTHMVVPLSLPNLFRNFLFPVESLDALKFVYNMVRSDQVLLKKAVDTARMMTAYRSNLTYKGSEQNIFLLNALCRNVARIEQDWKQHIGAEPFIRDDAIRLLPGPREAVVDLQRRADVCRFAITELAQSTVWLEDLYYPSFVRSAVSVFTRFHPLSVYASYKDTLLALQTANSRAESPEEKEEVGRKHVAFVSMLWMYKMVPLFVLLVYNGYHKQAADLLTWEEVLPVRQRIFRYWLKPEEVVQHLVLVVLAYGNYNLFQEFIGVDIFCENCFNGAGFLEHILANGNHKLLRWITEHPDYDFPFKTILEKDWRKCIRSTQTAKVVLDCYRFLKERPRERSPDEVVEEWLYQYQVDLLMDVVEHGLPPQRKRLLPETILPMEKTDVEKMLQEVYKPETRALVEPKVYLGEHTAAASR